MKPLIWTTIYGADSYFETLAVSLKSLVKYGKYQGELLLFSDRDTVETLKYVPEELIGSTSVVAIDEEKPTFKTRWKLAYKALPTHVNGHSPILHVDSDVVYDATIEPILHEISKTRKMTFCSERALYPSLRCKIGELRGEHYNAEWFGYKLFLEYQGVLRDMRIPCINAGIFGAPNIVVLASASELIAHQIDKLDPYYYGQFSDQPAVNFSMTIGNLLDEPILDRYTHFTTLSPPENEIRIGLGRRGFCHFLWARGDQKTEQMKAYLEKLEMIL